MDAAAQLERSVRRHSGRAPFFIADPARSVCLTRSFFPAYEGEAQPDGCLKIGLNLSGGGWLRQISNDGQLEGHWRKGAIAISALSQPSELISPDADMVGLAIDPTTRTCPREAAAIAELSRRPALLHDEVVEAVMIALWRSAEVHGASTAFFDHGLSLIVSRLFERAASSPAAQKQRALAPRTLARAMELIESRLGEDVSVAELAAAAGMDASSFTKAFARSTGRTPYAYFTFRRMERAKALLDAGAAVTEVALQLGYSNPSKFAAAFRRHIGCAPSEWRRRKR